MAQSEDRYELPSNTAGDIRKMFIWLCFGFGVLFALGLTFVIFAQSLVKFVPFSAEERFIKPYEGLLVEDLLSESEDSQIIQDYLEQLVVGLKDTGNLSDDLNFKIHYSDKLIENAYATLGGHIVVYRGLIDSVDSENGLVMVIAHEMAHIENRDPAAAMGRSLATSLIISSASGGYSDDVAEVLSNAGLNQFSRKQERKADILALDLINDYYGHVGGRDEFFQKMQGRDIDLAEWLSSHPEIESRISYLEKEITDKGLLVGDTIPFPMEIQKILDK